MLVGARVWHESWLAWVAVPVGVLSGAVFAACLGGLAVSRLQKREVGILRVLADAAR